MTCRRVAPWLCGCIVPVIFASDQPSAAKQQTTFRASADAVRFRLVSRNKQPVSGLAADDFELLDDDVSQSVTAFSGESAPINLSLVVVPPGWQGMAAEFSTINDDLRRMISRLAPTERVRLVTVAEPSSQVTAFEEPSKVRYQLDVPAISGTRRAYDALVALLIQRAPVERRHLIVMMLYGFDTGSFVPPTQLVGVAARSDAVLDVIFPPGQQAQVEPVPTKLAEATGGVAYRVGTGESVAQAVQLAIEQYRPAYVLGFIPQDVPAGGWHSLAVKIKKPGNFDVHARKAYLRGS